MKKIKLNVLINNWNAELTFLTNLSKKINPYI